ncbi:Translation protein, beta-barrel domain [Pseudocohnilembus persalinus]|uniref:Alanine--tRNA ligase n=1 Tax=Pseudocohnilembus persalinus TaxID=266149 RepID=A0A0V0QSW9_PSEPJ|nr:Translation protein, beta-barrel domain [Pseudocohnilembus persalinus]|eukprot:KRX05303.1 Translation protein, beta-barrel domain [Pseudocohnilembus persalinus]
MDSKKLKQEDEDFDEQIEEVQIVKAKTAKEMKAMYRPVFRENPTKYYPVEVFKKYGYSRAHCKCGTIYWRRTEERDTCGDSECVGSYTFIGKGFGQGKQGKKITYSDAWDLYKKAMTGAKTPCTAIDRYPVVARWRNDVDYVAAGIFCFQPYCVTGELEPPANPLIQPQFCLRFNDLDNIGLSGRHYSGFIMMGNQVFNKPNDFKYFDEECIEYHLEWLLSMGCDLDEVTLVEDVWSGGGNLGSSIEIFAHGLEVGNMVFTRFKYFPSGEIEELDVKVIDVGIGLERIPWLINGAATSYEDVFGNSFKWLQEKLSLNIQQDVWEKFGPYATLLNVDEQDDISKTWEKIAEKMDIGLTSQQIQEKIVPVKEQYIICDHTRTIFMAIYDGSLPSNVGGGSNIRNIIRRTFSILKKNNWFDKIGGIDGYLELMNQHKNELSKIYGPFKEYKSFDEIIKKEYNSWLSTNTEAKSKLDRLLKKNKVLSLDNWILAVTTYGISADQIQEITGQQIPGNFYYALAEQKESQQKQEKAVLYNTAHLNETQNLYYDNHKLLKFESKILEVFNNVTQKNKRNIVILESSAFYPTSGGQQNDIGKITIGSEQYQVVDVEKVGKCVLHILDRELEQENNDAYIGQTAVGEVDEERRTTLKNHHTATHIVFAACRNVLGPHIWQAGAKKTTKFAHLDITHYQSLNKEKELEIENYANNIVLSNKNINKSLIDKSVAEKEHGFKLYQGGIVPGNTLRIVNIDETDVEACCGTHADNTSEVGWIKILKSSRIQDGIVRLYFVAGTKVMEKLNQQSQVVSELQNLWDVQQTQIVSKADEIFNRAKKAEKEVEEQQSIILSLRMQQLEDKKTPLVYYRAIEQESRFYFSFMGKYIQAQKQNKQGVIFIGRVKPNGERFVFGQFGDNTLFNADEFLELFKDENECPNPKYTTRLEKLSVKEGKKSVKVDGVLQFLYNGKINENKVINYLTSKNFEKGEF